MRSEDKGRIGWFSGNLLFEWLIGQIGLLERFIVR